MRSVSVDHADRHADLLVQILERLRRVEGSVAGVRPGKVPAARAQHSATQNVVTATPTVVLWAGTETYDTDDFHEGVTNPSRHTIPPGLGGLYFATYSLAHPSGSGLSVAWVTVNGAGLWAPAGAVLTSSGLRLNGTDLIPVVPGDYLEVVTSQASGGTLAVGNSSDHFTVSLHGPWL